MIGYIGVALVCIGCVIILFNQFTDKDKDNDKNGNDSNGDNKSGYDNIELDTDHEMVPVSPSCEQNHAPSISKA